MGAFKLWKDTPEKVFGAPFKGGSISADDRPDLFGVGYIIGPGSHRSCAQAGAFVFVLIPAIKFF